MATGEEVSDHQVKADAGEPRWPMALAVLAAGGLRAALPDQLRNGDARWVFLVVVFVLPGAVIAGDPAASTVTDPGCTTSPASSSV